VKPLAKRLLQECGGLSGLLRDVERLKIIPGVGEATIAMLKAVQEAACRLVRKKPVPSLSFNPGKRLLIIAGLVCLT
jgi:DNA repair protein RadC